MRRTELLIKQIRQMTGNRDITGIYDDEFVQYLNMAQDVVFNYMVEHWNRFLIKESMISTVTGVKTYSFPVDMYKLKNMLYSSSGANGYSKLRKIADSESQNISGWYIKDGQIALNFKPSSGVDLLRVLYYKKLKSIDIRRGKITSLAPLTVTSVPTKTDFETDDFCIVDSNGLQKATSLKLTGFNSGTGVISYTGSLGTAAIGDYVCYGANATTNCELPDICEALLIDYCAMRIAARDTSVDIRSFSEIYKNTQDRVFEALMESDQDPYYDQPESFVDYTVW